MKQPKKLSREQKKILSVCGLNHAEWMGLYDDNDYLHVVHKDTNEIKIIDKHAVEVVESRVNNKAKSSVRGRGMNINDSEHIRTTKTVNVKDSDPDRETYEKNRPEPTKAIRAIDKNITSELYHGNGEMAMKLQNDLKQQDNERNEVIPEVEKHEDVQCEDNAQKSGRSTLTDKNTVYRSMPQWNKNQYNNTVCITGRISSDFRFSHEIFGESFYTVDVSVERSSGTYDTVPVMVSERLIDVSHDNIGQKVRVFGQFRSYNHRGDGRNRLLLSVFAREIIFVDNDDEHDNDNTIFLDGFICKPPVYRKTPMGREIADLLIAVNRPYGKSDYIPCICWGRDARYVGRLKVGEHIEIHGRIQSRVYTKRLSDGSSEERTAYEVSVSTLEVIEE